MDRSAAVARIKRGLGFRQDLDDVIVDALQAAQRELEIGSSFPWFLIVEDQPLTVVSGNPTVALPDGFLGLTEDEELFFVDDNDNLIRVHHRPIDEARLYYTGFDDGSPLAFSLRANSLYFWPRPAVDYTLSWSYYKRADSLVADIENAWLREVPELIIGRAGMIVAADLENDASLKKFTVMYATWKDWLTREMARRESEAMPRAMGRNR